MKKLIGYIKGWWDALMLALKLKKPSVNTGSVDNTK